MKLSAIAMLKCPPPSRTMEGHVNTCYRELATGERGELGCVPSDF